MQVRTDTPSQRDVAGWFDRTYREKGFGYLRPPRAYPIFLQLAGARPGQRLLDVACGPGMLLRAALDRGMPATGIDISAEAIALAQRYAVGAEVSAGNAESLPFADESFDLITCIGSLERFFDRDQALAEMRRVAAPSAHLCLMVRNASTPVWRVWRQLLGQRNHSGHQDALPLLAWRQLFGDCGFVVEAVYIDQWPRQRLRGWCGLGRKPVAGTAERIARPILPMRLANEFIFVLRRAADD